MTKEIAWYQWCIGLTLQLALWEWGWRKAWFVAVVNFCGIDTPTVADFKLPIWRQPLCKIPKNLTVLSSQCNPAPVYRSATVLGWFLIASRIKANFFGLIFKGRWWFKSHGFQSLCSLEAPFKNSHIHSIIQHWVQKGIIIWNEKRNHNKLQMLKSWQIPETSQNLKKSHNTFERSFYRFASALYILNLVSCPLPTHLWCQVP